MPQGTFIEWMNSWVNEWTNTTFPLGTYGCVVRDFQAKRGRWWANDKPATENVKQRELSPTPFKWMRWLKIFWGRMRDELNSASSSSSYLYPPSVPTFQRLGLLLAISMAWNWIQWPAPVPSWSVPWSLLLFLPDSSFVYFCPQVWILAVLAEGKVSYKTLISFSLILFLIKIFFLPFT